MVDAVIARPRNALRTLAVACGLALVALYFLAVRTAWGQRLNATALSGRRTLRPRAVHAAARLLTTIDVGSLVLIGAAIVLVALLRARPRLAAGAGVVIFGSVVTTEVLKRVVLSRPYLGVVDSLGTRPSFPSGHTTVAMSLAIAATLVAPGRWRVAVAVVGAGYASAIGVAVVATGNHRPCDPIAAALVVTMWAAATAAVLARDGDGRQPSSAPHATPLLAFGGLVLLVVGFVGLLATVVAIRRDRLDTVELGGAFFASATAIVGTVLVTTAALLAALRGVTLDRPVTWEAARHDARHQTGSDADADADAAAAARPVTR